MTDMRSAHTWNSTRWLENDKKR